MKKECFCCGYDICLDKHHPDGKENMIILHDITKGEIHEWPHSLKKEKEIKEMISERKKNGDSFLIHTEKKHKKPDNYVYLCPNCHRLVHAKKYGVNNIEKLKKFHRIAKNKNTVLTTAIIKILNEIVFLKSYDARKKKINDQNEKYWKELDELLKRGSSDAE